MSLQSTQLPQKIWTIPIYKCREAIVLCFNESTHWIVSKKKWDTKEDKGKHTLYVLWYAKGTSWNETMLTSEKKKSSP